MVLNLWCLGECRVIPECQPDELVDFPRRMREWLYNVMKELSERKELSYYYQQMEKEAEVIFIFVIKIDNEIRF